MAGFRYPYDIQTTLEPWREKLGSSFDTVVTHLADRDRGIEDFLTVIDPVGRLVAWSAALTVAVPKGWLLCDGSAVSRSVYSQLFAAVGTTYGVGDGSTTFNLPNLATQGRVIATYDASLTQFNAIGLAGGSITASLAAHSHGGSTATASVQHSHIVNNHNHFTNTGGISAFHSHNLTSGQVGTTSTGHDHHAASGQHAACPGGANFFTGVSGGVTDGDNVNHSHTIPNDTPGTDGMHGGDPHGHTIPAETGFGNNLPPYIVMRYLIRA